ncbi:hypothetical protein CJ739_90 [Mariniflexile rhizosphaerae]|nr:hypothetical protein CJ739_90 [Mariniflexile sp. TRM1-10]
MFSDYLFSFFGVLILWITAPVFLSAISTTAVVMYFISMTKINVVDVKYQGSWKRYFKSWFNIFKK